jgi:uncharacterized protein YjlB
MALEISKRSNSSTSATKLNQFHQVTCHRCESALTVLTRSANQANSVLWFAKGRVVAWKLGELVRIPAGGTHIHLGPPIADWSLEVVIKFSYNVVGVFPSDIDLRRQSVLKAR